MKSGVGGDCTLMGVEQAGDSTRSPLITTCKGIDVSFEEFLECAGGVGGRSTLPIILLLVCFSVRGEALMDEGEVTSVSKLKPRDALEELAFEDGVE